MSATKPDEIDPLACPCGHNCQYNLDQDCCGDDCDCERPAIPAGDATADSSQQSDTVPDTNATPAASTPAVAEGLARLFHETYERLAPSYGYQTREASAKPWSDVPEPNRSLMIAVAGEVAANWPWTNALEASEASASTPDAALEIRRTRAGQAPPKTADRHADHPAAPGEYRTGNRNARNMSKAADALAACLRGLYPEGEAS